eukprot:s699_g19.t1
MGDMNSLLILYLSQSATSPKMRCMQSQRRRAVPLALAVICVWQVSRSFVGLQATARQVTLARHADSFKLRYFDAKGAAETIRLVFAAAGKDYEDVRYPISFGTPGDFSTIVRKACMEWARRVHDVQSKRNPHEWEAAKQRIESAREHERQSRKCKAAKNHAIRSRALAAEGLRQMSAMPASEHLAVQTRWKSAQESSSRFASAQWDAFSREAPAVPEPQLLIDEDEDEAMAEAADLMGAGDVNALTALANDGLQEDVPRTAGAGRSIDDLLSQLRKEPANEEECAAKFMLYDAWPNLAICLCSRSLNRFPPLMNPMPEGYAREVEEMRSTLLKFNEETRPSLPATVAADLGNQIRKIDSTEAMGIPDDVREWFVFHMMRKAERNNLSMARILETFEKKLAFLANNDQQECPVCLEKFETGDKAPETLGCCHKVCKECWESWTQEFEADRDAGKMDISMGKVPVLDVGDFSLPQSKAIERYVARKFGMMGSTPEEEALVDAMAEHVRDVNEAYNRKGLFFMKDEEKKAELKKKWYDEELPPFLTKLDTALPGSDGFAVGKKVSLADVAIFKLLKDTYDTDVSDAYKSCPKLKAIVSSMEKNDGIKKWLEESAFAPQGAMAPGAWSGFRRSSQRTRRQATHCRVGWSWLCPLCPLLFPALAFCGSLRPVSLWRLPEADQHSRLELEATAAPIARKKTGSALTKRVPPPSVKVTKLKKGERYRGYINPKLKALVEASEYRKVVDLLARLEKEGQLDRLLVSAEGYWKDLNIFEFSALEKEEGRRAVSKILRRDWSSRQLGRVLSSHGGSEVEDK